MDAKEGLLYTNLPRARDTTTTTHKHTHKLPSTLPDRSLLLSNFAPHPPGFAAPPHAIGGAIQCHDTTQPQNRKEMDPPTTLGIMSKATSVHPHFLGEQSGHHYAIAHDGRSGYFPEDQSRNSGIFRFQNSFYGYPRTLRRVESALASVIRLEKASLSFLALPLLSLVTDLFGCRKHRLRHG